MNSRVPLMHTLFERIKSVRFLLQYFYRKNKSRFFLEKKILGIRDESKEVTLKMEEFPYFKRPNGFEHCCIESILRRQRSKSATICQLVPQIKQNNIFSDERMKLTMLLTILTG